MKMPVAKKGNELAIAGMLVNIPENVEFNFRLEKGGAGLKTQYWKAVVKDNG